MLLVLVACACPSGTTALDEDAPFDLSGELAGADLGSPKLDDLGNEGAIDRNEGWNARLDEPAGNGAFTQGYHYYGLSDDTVFRLATVRIGLRGWDALRERSSTDADTLEAAAADLSYTPLDRDADGAWPVRGCVYAGLPEGTYGDGTLRKWCFELDGAARTVQADEGTAAQVEWCTDPTFCGGDGVAVTFPGTTPADLPGVSGLGDDDEGFDIGFYLAYGEVAPSPGEADAISFAKLVAETFAPEPSTTCALAYDDSAEVVDTDEDGFIWESDIAVGLW